MSFGAYRIHRWARSPLPAPWRDSGSPATRESGCVACNDDGPSTAAGRLVPTRYSGGLRYLSGSDRADRAPMASETLSASPRPLPFKRLTHLIRQSVSAWLDHKASSLGAALA